MLFLVHRYKPGCYPKVASEETEQVWRPVGDCYNGLCRWNNDTEDFEEKLPRVSTPVPVHIMLRNLKHLSSSLPRKTKFQ